MMKPIDYFEANLVNWIQWMKIWRLIWYTEFSGWRHKHNVTYSLASGLKALGKHHEHYVRYSSFWVGKHYYWNQHSKIAFGYVIEANVWVNCGNIIINRVSDGNAWKIYRHNHKTCFYSPDTMIGKKTALQTHAVFKMNTFIICCCRLHKKWNLKKNDIHDQINA